MATLPLSSTLIANAFNNVWQNAITLQGLCLQLQNATTGGASVGFDRYLAVAQQCVSFTNVVNSIALNTPLLNAVVAYAQSAANNSGISATSFGNANTAAGNIITALEGEFPHDAQGHLTYQTFNTTTGVVVGTTTSAAMPNTTAAVAAFIATLS